MLLSRGVILIFSTKVDNKVPTLAYFPCIQLPLSLLHFLPLPALVLTNKIQKNKKGVCFSYGRIQYSLHREIFQLMFINIGVSFLA